MKDIKFVYFDIDDTLLDHRKAQDRALVDVQERYKTHFKDASLADIQNTYATHNSQLWREYAAGKIDRVHLQEQRFLRLAQDMDVTTVSHEELGTFYLEQYALHWDYCEGAREAFFHVADRYPVGVLTNGFAEVQHAKLARFEEVKERLDATVISEEVGFMKPHPELFKHATDLTGLAPSEILYVGDSFSSDVEGGLNAGWQVVWYHPRATNIPEGIHHIRELSDLQQLL